MFPRSPRKGAKTPREGAEESLGTLRGSLGVSNSVPDAHCELCEREVPRTTVHHLLPKSTGRRKGLKVVDLPTAELCPPCHRQLHALFPNGELARRLDSIEALREDERVARFVAWVRKQAPTKGVRVRRG